MSIVSIDNPNDDGPKRFIRKWLTFDDSRPTYPRLVRNFIRRRGRLRSHRVTGNCHRIDALTYSTLPIVFTAAISRALSVAMNFANSGASI